jgi:hypothetical protein
MSRARAPPQQVPEDEEIDEMDEEEMEDDMEEMDMFEALGSLLATEDGETLATLVKRQADAVEKISLNFEMQNKILVKILSALSTKCDCPCKEPKPVDSA